MDAKELEKKVLKEYQMLNIEDGRRDAAWSVEQSRLPSNQIRALIKIIAPLLGK